jgi:hypothetical protein
MADYYPVISRVVAVLENNSGENRRAIYANARSTLLVRLRAIVPVLSESDITRERLALEEAIRRVEFECERNLAVSSQLSPAQIRPATARQWQRSLGFLPWRRGLHPRWYLNKLPLALWRAVYRIVFVTWLFSLGLLLTEGWIRSGWWDGKIALALALSVLMRLADRLDIRFRPRSRPPIAARNRVGEPGDIAVRASPRSRVEAAALRSRVEPAHIALANQRATALLLENLSDQQRRQYRTHRHFDVIGGESGKRYRIWHRPSMNVAELDGFGKPKWIWCFHPVGVVVCDVLLSQKMALELFEPDAIRIANKFSVEPYMSALVALESSAHALRPH